MKKIRGIVFRVQNPQALASWYKEVLGFQTHQDSNGFVCEYPGNGARIKLVLGSGVMEPRGKDRVYWKIGLAMPDVDLGRKRILTKNTNVTQPSQFLDIGYLCHLSDPDGFSIELLQHDFQKNFVQVITKENLVLGQDTLIGQITLRCSDIDESLRFYQDLLGMKLLSIQNVEQYGFSLYFLAYTNENPPEKDLNSINIREWLWKRPYTTLELQHVPKCQVKGMTKEGLGVDCIEFIIDEDIKRRIMNSGLLFEDHGDRLKINDPNGAFISLQMKP